MPHTLVTFIADIDSQQRPTLEALLGILAKDPAHNTLLPFGNVKALHFASVNIFSNELGKSQDTLVLELNGDGTADTLLRALWEQGQSGMEALFRCCTDYGTAPKEFSQFRDFLGSKLQKPSAWHIGNVGLSVERILQEQQLRLALESHLDALRATHQLPTDETALRDEIVRFVRQNHAWALAFEPRQTQREQLLPVLKLGGFILVLIALLVRGWRVTLPGVLLLVALLRWHEMQDARQTTPRLEPSRQAAQEAAEFAQGQNHLSSLIRVQPGPFRRCLIWLVLFVVNLGARNLTKGELGGIPSIHFAHWSLVDGGKRLLFLSNFDNSWGSYLDDFTDKASGGLTAVWSNTRWFPPTRFLLKDGARAGARFKTWARLSQEPARVWYRAYPHLSVTNIERNSALRQGLSQTLTGSALTAWLRLL